MHCLLGVSRFSVYILEHSAQCEQTTTRVIHCPEIIVAASVQSSSSHLGCKCEVIIVSRCSVWKTVLSSHSGENLSPPPSIKKRKKNEESSNSDIFADLLSQRQQRPSEKSQVVLTDNDCILHTSGSILDMVCQDSMVALLVDKDSYAHVEVYRLSKSSEASNNKARCVRSFSTGINSCLFDNMCGTQLTQAKALYLVAAEGHRKTPSSAIPERQWSQPVVSLSTKLFTLLFGTEAAVMKSPVLLLCDRNGRVYFYPVKSISNNTNANCVCILSEMNSQAVWFSQVDLDNKALYGSAENRDLALSLECALNGKSVEPSSHGDTIPALLVVCLEGECCMFTIDKDEGLTTLAFSLPHPVRLCTTLGDTLLYTTESNIEACSLRLKSRNGCLAVDTEQKELPRAQIASNIISLSWLLRHPQGSQLVAMTDELEVVYLPLPQEASQDEATEVNSGEDLSMEAVLKSTAGCSEDIQAVGDSISQVDSSLTQLNLFASIARNGRACLDKEESVVSCTCSVSTQPNAYSHEKTLLVKLRNTTDLPFTNVWKVDICVSRQMEMDSDITNFPNVLRHFVTPLSKGLAPQSTITIAVPITEVCTIPLSPLAVCVSLVLSLEKSHSNSSRSPDSLSLKHPLVVPIYNHTLEVLDLMHVIYDKDPNTYPLGHFGRAQSSDHTSSFIPECPSETETRILGISRERGRKVKEAKSVSSLASNHTFALSLEVPADLYIFHKIQSPSDVLSLLLCSSSSSSEDNTSQNMEMINQAAIQLQTLCGVSTVSLAVSAQQPGNGARVIHPLPATRAPPAQTSAFTVTLRSQDIPLLVATRTAVKRKLARNLKNQHTDSKQGETTLNRSQLCRGLQQCERITEDVQSLQRKLKSQDKDVESSSEDAHLLCSLFDKFDIIK